MTLGPVADSSGSTLDLPLKALQGEVHLRLGQCVHRLQQYERALKSMIAQGVVEGPVEQFASIQQQRETDVRTKTLGILVGLFTTDLLKQPECPADTTIDRSAPDDSQGDTARMSVRMSIVMTPKRYLETKEGLAELVTLRNELVHHFVDHLDIRSADSCRAAITHLVGAHDQVERHFRQVADWALNMERARALSAAFMQSSAFEDMFVHGINPDGSVCWRRSTVVECLHEAETLYQADGWTSLTTAIRFIQQSHPDQTPSRYGCKTWRQIMRKSGQFQLRSEAPVSTQPGRAWYRSAADGMANCVADAGTA
jgi:hypothetical protein